MPEQRHHDNNESSNTPMNKREDQSHRHAAGHAQAFEGDHQALHQVRQHHPGQYRREHAAQGELRR